MAHTSSLIILSLNNAYRWHRHRRLQESVAFLIISLRFSIILTFAPPHSLDLIRHGKHDRVHHAVDGTAQKNRDKDQLRATQNQQGSTKKGDRAFVKDSCPSPNYRREVELIVQEENEAKGRLPTYKGLENFKLLEKMGEYVLSWFQSHKLLTFVCPVGRSPTCTRLWT